MMRLFSFGSALVLMSKCTIFCALDVLISNEKDTLYIDIYSEIGV
jgi:hypothetical protein